MNMKQSKHKLNDQTNGNGQRLPHSPFRLHLCGLAYTVGILIGKNLLRNYVAPAAYICFYACRAHICTLSTARLDGAGIGSRFRAFHKQRNKEQFN